MTRERLVRPGSKTAAKAALVAFIAACLLTLTPVRAAAQTPKPDVYFVPNVVEQFRALSLRPEPFGMWVWGHPDPENNIDKHYQGIARTMGPGIPHMFLAWNGNDSNCVFCDDEPGQLFILRMGSRDVTGERLRSNRLHPDDPISAVDRYGNDVGTPPDLRDCLVGRIVFNGTGGWPNYMHPGAMQVVGDVLAVPLSKPGAGDVPMRIQFIDITEPAVPRPLSSLIVTGGKLELRRGIGRVDAGSESLRRRPAIPDGARRRGRPGAPSLSIALHRRERRERCERPQGRQPRTGRSSVASRARSSDRSGPAAVRSRSRRSTSSAKGRASTARST